MTDTRLGRRRLLAAVGTGLATGLAGCGYHAAAGDLDWSESFNPYVGSAMVTWFGDGTHLFCVFDGTTGPFGLGDGTVHVYDGSGEAVWAGSLDVDRHGDPTVADGAVFAPLEDGTVVRFERDSDEQHQRRFSSTVEGAQTAWSTEWYDSDGSDASGTGSDDGGDTSSSESNDEDDTPTTKSDDGGDTPTTESDDGGDTPTTESDDGGDDQDQPPSLSLEATDALVAGAYADGIVAFDAADGDELFHLLLEDEVFEAIDDGGSDNRQVRDLAVGDELVWAALGDRESVPILVAIDTAGSVVADAELPQLPDWLETIDGDGGSSLLLAVEDELQRRDRNGESVYTVPLESTARSHEPTVVETDASSRLYHASDDSLTAIDLDTGKREWHREDVRFTTGPVANADGIYGHGTLEDDDGRDCDLVGITADGDDWWWVERYEAVDCADELFLVADRLVAIADETLYGFRWEPGSRYTLL